MADADLDRGDHCVPRAALRAGLSLGYGCSSGNCGQCKAKLLSGQVQKTRHYDYVLSEAEKNAGVVLMCCNTAVVNLVIEAREAHGAAVIAAFRYRRARSDRAG